jgi:hypothetical protein
MKSICFASILICVVAASARAQNADELDFTSGLGEFSEMRRMLPSYLNGIGYRKLAERKQQVEGLATMEDVAKRKAFLREHMVRDLGGFPERTSLNPRVVGVFERPAYRIEKVIFESQPHFCVTAIKLATLVGKTMVGMRALDISREIDLLEARPEVDRDRIYGHGKRGGTVSLLYAAVLDKRIRKAAFEGMLVSYESVVNGRVNWQILGDVVPGALKCFDLPDLVATLAGREVWLADSADPLGHSIPVSEVLKQYIATEAFKRAGAERAIHIRNLKPLEDTSRIFQEGAGTR